MLQISWSPQLHKEKQDDENNILSPQCALSPSSSAGLGLSLQRRALSWPAAPGPLREAPSCRWTDCRWRPFLQPPPHPGCVLAVSLIQSSLFKAYFPWFPLPVSVHGLKILHGKFQKYPSVVNHSHSDERDEISCLRMNHPFVQRVPALSRQKPLGYQVTWLMLP